MFVTAKSVLSILWFLHHEISFVNSFPNEEPIMTEADGSSETTTLSTVHEKDLPLDLYDIGYMGTWERFCDPEEIGKEFTLYPHHHALMQLRNTICSLRRQNQIDKNAILSFAVYKYCNMMRTRVDELLAALIEKFSSGDRTKKLELLDEGPLIDFTECYKEAIAEFKRKCMGEENPYFDMFKPLIGRACFAEWLTQNTVFWHINEVCNGKWISDQIDWNPILSSIKYKDGKENTAWTISVTEDSIITSPK